MPPGKNDDGKRLDCAVRHFIIPPGGLSRTADNWVAEVTGAFLFSADCERGSQMSAESAGGLARCRSMGSSHHSSQHSLHY